MYHYTSVSNLAEILRDGIQPSSTHRDALEHELATVAETYGINHPIDRVECVFFYPWIPHPSTERKFETDGGNPTLGTRREGILVVDVELVDSRLYVADFKLFSDAIDFQYMSEPDDAMVTESREDALRRYAESITRIESESFERLDEICSQFHLPEVVGEGSISADAIVECVLNDEYFTRLL